MTSVLYTITETRPFVYSC